MTMMITGMNHQARAINRGHYQVFGNWMGALLIIYIPGLMDAATYWIFSLYIWI